MKKVAPIAVLFVLLGLTSCSSDKNESMLSASDIEYIQGLGILDKNEEIEMFESNGGMGGIKQSGNFITKLRIASYWIDKNDTTMNSAFFSNEIDTITFTDLVTKLTYASYLTVLKADGQEFNVYVDADSSRTYQFYEKALSNWRMYRAK